MAVKNDVDVFYFAVIVPLHMFFDENGQMDKREFLQLWKEIPEQNELQFSINNTQGLNAGRFILFISCFFSFHFEALVNRSIVVEMTTALSYFSLILFIFSQRFHLI